MKQALKCDFTWADFKTNSDGMVPVVVQDAENDEVLMLAYMNEEAFETTLRLGKMTYWSRSRNELWIKGLSSGHVQYVKQLLRSEEHTSELQSQLRSRMPSSA